MLATAGQPPGFGDDWVVEPKFDGARCAARIGSGRAELFSRRANNLTGFFPDVVTGCLPHAHRDAILDGEIIVLDDRARPNFQLLQHRLHTPRPSGTLQRRPPFGPAFAPAHDVAGRLRDRLLAPMIVGSFERAIKPALDVVRDTVGAPPATSIRAIYSSAPLTLYLTAEPFEYRRSDWPASYRLVGPLSFEPSAESPEWLDEINQPIVLVTTSSEFQDDGKLIGAALDGLRDEDLFVVATLPSGDPSTFDVPTNARVQRWLPHSVILPRATCVITHGGMGATQKALAAGVPVVAVPFGRDQHEVARRVEVSGAGVRLPSSKLTPRRLREAVDQARNQRHAAHHLARELASAGGATRAAEEIEALTGSQLPSHTPP